MSENSKVPAEPNASAEPDAGHGKHRGPVSERDGEGNPRGRHRRPSAESEGTTRAA